jgi:hypothetical protein
VGIKASLEHTLGLKINIPEEPQIVGALGAALIAKESINVKVKGEKAWSTGSLKLCQYTAEAASFHSISWINFSIRLACCLHQAVSC